MKNTYGDAETEETTLQKKVNELVQARNELEAMKTVCEGLKQLLGTKEDATSLYFENKILRAENAQLRDALKIAIEDVDYISNGTYWKCIAVLDSTTSDPLYSSAPEMLEALRVIYSNRPKTLRQADLQDFACWFSQAWEEDIAIIIKKADGKQSTDK